LSETSANSLLPGFGNIGGIIAVWAFLAKDAPKYITGYSICLAFTVISIIACIVYGVGCWAANRRRDRTPVDIGLTEYEKTEMVSLFPKPTSTSEGFQLTFRRVI